jgi:photosystem II stability/assembly factor-like uncharacterized protein
MAVVIGIVAADLGAQRPAAATGGDEYAELVKVLRWRSVGPLRGGRSIAVGGSAARPLEYYFGATGGGVWKTTDGGLAWAPVADRFLGTSSVGAIAVSPSNPDVVYAGTGESKLRGNIIQGDGVYKTIDGGTSWTHLGLDDTLTISRVRVDPANPDLVYVTALGDPYGPNPERGVFRSKDGGKAWQKVLFRDEKTGGEDLAIDPRNPKVLYASLWEVYRTPHSLSSGGPGSGLFKSSDGGDTWTELTRNPGMPKGLIGKISVSVSGSASGRIYALIEAQDGGLFSSDDGGATWTAVNKARLLWQRAFYFLRVHADPVDRDTVYILNYDFLKSTDGGKTFQKVAAPHADHHDMWIAPDNPRRIIDSNDGGANVSPNGGRSWTQQTYATGQLYNAFTTRHVPYHVCGAQQDNTTVCVPSDGRGASFYAVGGGESGYIAADPTNTDVFYAGSYGGYITRFDRATGQRRFINVWPEYPMGQSSKDLTERFQWTAPIVFSPLDPQLLFMGSQHLWRTSNGGQTWTKISPDLTRHDPATLGPSGGPITLDQTGVETYATIFTIAPSRHDAGTIWTGSDDGLVHVTRDGGKNWTNVTPPDLPPFSRISLVEASPHDPATAFVAANRYQRADRAPYVFRTGDFGRTWTKIVNGIPAGDFPRVIREDVVRRDLLYLGTERGIFLSTDGGAQWQPLRLNLPVTPVHGIVSERNDLVIATHGRGFYVMDQARLLRQLAPGVTSTTRLFDPGVAVRSVSRGVTIDYSLAAAVPELALEILDDKGQMVRRISPAASADRAEPADDEDSGPPEPKLGTAKGMNRYVWDMRAAPSHAFPGLIMYQASTRGPVVPPGRYQVRLVAGDAPQTQPLTIERDPRLTDVTDADLQEQFRIAREIQDKFSLTNDTVSRIRRIKDDIADRLSKTGSADIKMAGEQLTVALTEIEGKLYQYRNRAAKDPLNFPPQLNNKLGSLLQIVESADARPTDSSQEVFKTLSEQVDGQFAALSALLRRDLTLFNRFLTRSRLAPIVE